MGQEIFRQGNFTAGELDPQLIGRRDTKAYFAALAKAQNLLVTPQGPITRRPGTSFIARLRHPLTEVPMVGVSYAAPVGGSPENLADGSPPFETTAPLGAGDQVLVEITFPAPVTLSCVDVRDFYVRPAPVAPGDPEPPPPEPAPITMPWDWRVFHGHPFLEN